jgi:hypothetical protein
MGFRSFAEKMRKIRQRKISQGDSVSDTMAASARFRYGAFRNFMSLASGF